MKQLKLILFGLLLSTFATAQVKIEVDATQEGTTMSKDLIGAFFEDINYGADGGLYAELVQNRSFEYHTVSGYTNLGPLEAWELIPGTGDAKMLVENTSPLNQNNTHYLRLAIKKSGEGIGFKNTGFDGIALEADNEYNFSAYIRRDEDTNQALVVKLETVGGKAIATDTIDAVTGEWKKYSLQLTADRTYYNSRLSITTSGGGNVYFDMVSLFPQNTFKGRENGLRKDLAQAVADLEPKFLRFPGGCVSHGRGIDNAYRWKETIGDVAERTPNWNLWGYHQTYGLGFYEYFLYCEDIHAMPLPVLPVGISCQFRNREIVPMDEMQPWADDALDLIEFANGAATTEWGAKRAEMGHPEPFNLTYICLGNEEDDIPEFRQRFSFIADQIREKYPEIKIIGTSGTAASGTYYTSLWDYSRKEKLDAVDEHYYMDPNWFLNNNHRYDNFDRKGPKVFIGEYASRNDLMGNAIAEAAYLTGVERNSDVVELTCYAPLFCNVNHNQWNPDLIRFDNTKVVKTASYYVQQMYSVNAGDEYLPSTITYDENASQAQADYSGKIGLGTWNTQAQFDNIKITSGDKVLAEETFDGGSSNWSVSSGTFTTSNGVYEQTSSREPALSIFSYDVKEKDYTVTLMAKKTGGYEGFLIPFAFKNSSEYYWLNIAGWGNTQHAIEHVAGGPKSVLYTAGGSIENNKWYEIKMVFANNQAKFYLNDKLILELPEPPGPVTASISKDLTANDLILKLVNSGATAIDANIAIAGYQFKGEAKAVILSGKASQKNSIDQPDLIAPVEKTIEVSNNFAYTLPANSFQVIRISMANFSSDIRQIKESDQSQNIKILPNPTHDKAQVIFKQKGKEEFALFLYDLQGRQLRKQMVSSNKQVFIEKGDLPSGDYIVRMNNKTEDFSKKIVFN